MTLALETQALTKRYGRRLALDAVDLAVEPGTVFGVIGPNGAGKTTTMRCVFGLARPDRGEVRWNGSPVDRVARLREQAQTDPAVREAMNMFDGRLVDVRSSRA